MIPKIGKLRCFSTEKQCKKTYFTAVPKRSNGLKFLFRVSSSVLSLRRRTRGQNRQREPPVGPEAGHRSSLCRGSRQHRLLFLRVSSTRRSPLSHSHLLRLLAWGIYFFPTSPTLGLGRGLLTPYWSARYGLYVAMSQACSGPAGLDAMQQSRESAPRRAVYHLSLWTTPQRTAPPPQSPPTSWHFALPFLRGSNPARKRLVPI